jgi:hypothetical protein
MLRVALLLLLFTVTLFFFQMDPIRGDTSAAAAAAGDDEDAVNVDDVVRVKGAAAATATAAAQEDRATVADDPMNKVDDADNSAEADAQRSRLLGDNTATGPRSNSDGSRQSRAINDQKKKKNNNNNNDSGGGSATKLPVQEDRATNGRPSMSRALPSSTVQGRPERNQRHEQHQQQQQPPKDEPSSFEAAPGAPHSAAEEDDGAPEPAPVAKEIPQPPNPEQLEEPVVEVSAVTKKERLIQRGSRQQQQQQPPAPPTLVDEPGIGTDPPAASERQYSIRNTPQPVMASDEGEGIDKGAESDAEDSRATPGSHQPSPPTQMTEGTAATDSARAADEIAGNAAAEDGGGGPAQRKIPKKGSLAEFFKNANDNKSDSQRRRPAVDSRNDSAKEKMREPLTVEAPPENTRGGDQYPSNTTDVPSEPLDDEQNIKAGVSSDDPAELIRCGVWGSYAFGRRRTADLSILYRVFRNVEEDDTFRDKLLSPASDTAALLQKMDDALLGHKKPDKAMRLDSSIPEVGRRPDSDGADLSSASGNEFVDGLDDIDKLFEGIDPPDELDVGVDGRSIQEVLLGSATRVLLKRIAISARWTKEKLSVAKDSIANRLRNEEGDFAPLERFRNEDGELLLLQHWRTADGDFAPFRRLRNEEGELAPLRRFRDERGKFVFPSNDQLLTAASKVKDVAVKIFRKTRDLLYRIIEGDDMPTETFAPIDFGTVVEKRRGAKGTNRATLENGPVGI